MTTLTGRCRPSAKQARLGTSVGRPLTEAHSGSTTVGGPPSGAPPIHILDVIFGTAPQTRTASMSEIYEAIVQTISSNDHAADSVSYRQID